MVYGVEPTESPVLNGGKSGDYMIEYFFLVFSLLMLIAVYVNVVVSQYKMSKFSCNLEAIDYCYSLELANFCFDVICNWPNFILYYLSKSLINHLRLFTDCFFHL